MNLTRNVVVGGALAFTLGLTSSHADLAARGAQQSAALTAFDFTGPVAIPDLGTVDAPVVVSGLTRLIRKVTVSVYLTHTFDSDVTISVIGPDGTTARLSANRGGKGDNYGSACAPLTARTAFDDSAATQISAATAPFIGTFRPEEALVRFAGKSGTAANGTWTLRINDNAAEDTGMLQCWSLNITEVEGAAVASDFNADGAADLAVFRPSTGQWFVNNVSVPAVGQAGDVPVAGDYDGDGAIEAAAYRPSTGQWFFATGSPASLTYGQPGDLPVPADYDGDFRTDVAVYRTIDGAGVWRLNVPAQPPVSFGLRGDVPMPGDYDGDGKADLGIFRPSTGQWFVSTAASGFTSSTATTFGVAGDVPVRADLDNDHKLDFVVFRPSAGTWFWSPTNSPAGSFAFGTAGDIPAGLDVSGDGSDELCVFRPLTGQWFIRDRVLATTTTVVFGVPGDVPAGARPQLPSAAVSDFDGDGASDLTFVRSNEWFTKFSRGGYTASSRTMFASPTDVPANLDFDGDRRADVGFFRPSTGQWFIIRSSCQNICGLIGPGWGVSGDKPVPADYDGDGRMDLAVFRPSTGQWFVRYSSTNAAATTQWGVSTDVPFANDFDGDGRADLAVYRPATGQWFLQLSTTTFGATITRAWGMADDVPVTGDFDGDGRSEIAVFRPSTGQWLAADALTGALVLNVTFGLATDILVPHDYDADGRTDPAVYRPSTGEWVVRRSSNGATLTVVWGGASGDTPR
jgi:subtilisin-like proprotein convertase family protein